MFKNGIAILSNWLKLGTNLYFFLLYQGPETWFVLLPPLPRSFWKAWKLLWCLTRQQVPQVLSQYDSSVLLNPLFPRKTLNHIQDSLGQGHRMLLLAKPVTTTPKAATNYWREPNSPRHFRWELGPLSFLPSPLCAWTGQGRRTKHSIIQILATVKPRNFCP